VSDNIVDYGATDAVIANGVFPKLFSINHDSN